MVLKLDVIIETGLGIGGISPFVVVCFDNNLEDEIYKSKVAVGGQTTTWNETFELDLTTQMKNAMANDRPEPTYLTFNVFDSGKSTMPSLGSAGVLLATVRAQGYAKGDFPLVNGDGKLSLTVGPAPKPGWIHTPAAKKAGIAAGAVGAVGVGALAIGLTRHLVNNKKKGKEPGNGRPGGSST